ncbi:carboxylesterase family protein [Sulfitobacter sp.]|uniref:carboxylesterase family protein n=1 Tax=Sulfitobacter sp. TaxID=1903071 RepID=UPI0030027810
MIPRVTVPFGVQQITGLRKTHPVLMPDDDSAKAVKFRKRNAGKTFDRCEFRGIPFCTSIVADGWWSTPEALTELPSSPFDATSSRRIALQTTGPSVPTTVGWRASDIVGAGVFEWDERGVIEHPDSALLDISTDNPAIGANKPVTVNIHGGGNTENPRILPRFEGAYAIGRVYVTVEWPLSTQGFFTHPALGEDHQINQAYDVVLKALEWVQLHISNFGGDPNNVTLGGTSAGGQMATLLMPMGGTLFHRVISHSGGDTAGRPSRAYCEELGKSFWHTLIKGKPAFFDPTRTIAEIAEQDGIAAALRLGPSPEQILAFKNQRKVWSVSDGVLVAEQVGPLNIWPANDGVIVQNRTAPAEIAADRWPTSVAYMSTWVANEASLINEARYDENADDYFRRVGITTDEEIATATALISPDGDDLERLAYGLCVFGYGANRLPRDFAAKGGTAYELYFKYDSLGNGKRLTGHANQQVWFNGRPDWQVAQGESAESLRLQFSDLVLSAYLQSSIRHFMSTGDPNGPVLDDLDLFEPSDFDTFEPFAAMGPDRITNIVENNLFDNERPAVRQAPNHLSGIWDYFDST